jgi:ferredoxin
VSINTLIKTNNKAPVKSKNPLVIVAPVYAGRIPRVLEQYIEEVLFLRNKNAYFIVTCAATPWIAVDYVKKLCKQKGLNLLGFNSLVMPQNNIAYTDIKTDTENDEIISIVTPKIKQIAELIKVGHPLPSEEPGKALMSRVLNPVMYAMIIKAKGFCITDVCEGCGKCAERCSLNNIELISGNPKWGRNCTHCMACIGGCQYKAIEFGKKTSGRNRYYNTKTP